MGVERFIARRGTPKTILSDNGTNFVGAQKELLSCVQNWNKVAPAVFVHKGVKWKFNPPSAPHHGGAWERLVRSVKRVLYDILGSRRLTEEVLGTTLCLVEQLLNARPITPVSSDPHDLEALTPNHFILGHSAASFPSLSFEDNLIIKSVTPEHNRTLTQFGHAGCVNMYHLSTREQSGIMIRMSH